MERKVYPHIKYSIVICYNNKKLLNESLYSLNCCDLKNYEVIDIDNRCNSFNIPKALNIGIQRSNGENLIFCHQDVIYPQCWLKKIDQQIDLISKLDVEWGVLGVMGVQKNGFFAGNLIDPHTKSKFEKLPCVVKSLDEVCLVIRNSCQLCFDESLGGYHLYGADICLQAERKGMKCYAIDAPLTHLSGGRLDHFFWEMAGKLHKKWSLVQGSPSTIETTCGVFRLKNTFWSVLEYNFKILRRKIIRRIQKRHIRFSSE